MRFQLNIILILFSSVKVFAQEKTFIREYTYRASDMDSKFSCRTIVKNELRITILEEIGIYIENEKLLTTSETNGKYSQDFSEKISTITAGITKFEVLDEKWDMQIYWMKASISVDPKSLKESLNQYLNDRQKLKELEITKKQLIEAQKEIAQLKEQAKKGNITISLKKEYDENIQKMNLSELHLEEHNAYERKNYKEAFEICNKMIELDPNDEYSYYERGAIERELKDYPSALNDFTKAIELKNTWQAYSGRAGIKHELNDHYGAIDDLTRAIESDSTDQFYLFFLQMIDGIYCLRGNEKIEVKDYKGALADYSKVKPSEMPDIFFWRAFVKVQLQDYIGALHDSDELLKLNSNKGAYYDQRSLIEFKLGHYNLALNDISKAIEIDPINEDYYQKRTATRLVINERDYYGVITDYDQLIKINSTNSDYWEIRGVYKILVKNINDGCYDLKRADQLGNQKARRMLSSVDSPCGH